ncbi:MAG: asparagine synthase (glutamine-hydrolyzing) [Psychroserpens sp.]|jgi:asparagine synthase (glutamine-hydrolysing)
MIGLYFSNKSKPKSGFVEVLDSDNQDFKIKTFNNLNFNIGLVYPSFNEENAFAQSFDNWILIDGFIFNEKGAQISANTILKRIIEEGEEVINSFNGEFFMALFLNGKLRFQNDILGQRQHCIAQNKSDTAIAPSPGKALDLIGATRKIDKEALFIFINTKKLRHHENTIWQNCKIITYASVLTYETGEIKVNRYWEFKQSKTLHHFDVDEFIHIYKKAVNSRVLKDKVGLTLTGGLDSRSMLAAVDVNSRAKIRSTTMGMEDCDEVNIAKKVAKKINVNHQAFTIEPEAIFSEEALNYFNNEDVDLLTQGLWLPYTSSLKGIPYLLHGLDLDVTLGGIYLTEELLNIKSENDFKQFVLKDNLRLDSTAHKKLFKASLLQELEIDIHTYIIDLLGEQVTDDFVDSYDKFIMKYSMNRVILQRYRSIRNNIETISPMYDRNLIAYLLSIPTNERANYKAFFPFINKLTPELCKIEYQRTGLPANVDVKFWKESQQIESTKEELNRKIALDSKGENFIPYKRYYTNVDEWMRFNEKWKNVITDLLQSEKSILRKEWVNADYLDTIITNHQNHVTSNFGLIQCLMSAEVYLRIEKFGKIELS